MIARDHSFSSHCTLRAVKLALISVRKPSTHPLLRTESWRWDEILLPTKSGRDFVVKRKVLICDGKLLTRGSANTSKRHMRELKKLFIKTHFTVDDLGSIWRVRGEYLSRLLLSY